MSSKQNATVWPWIITGILVAFAMGMGGLIVMAVSSPFELVYDDYYERELAYQEQIDREQRTLALAEQPTVRYDATAEAIRIRFPESLPSVDAGEVEVYRASARAMDRLLPLDLGESGTFEISRGAMVSGLWSIRLRWTMDGRGYFQKTALMLP
ncbi:MAG: FixH family protein [Verrucomicrobiota bacterium]